MFQLPDAPSESMGRLSKYEVVYVEAIGAHISNLIASICPFCEV